ncbi:MAG: histidinol-phosphate transaminase [Nostocoides sp.]
MTQRETGVKLRQILHSVPGYVAGRPAAAQSEVTPYKVSSNENPYPPLPSVLGVLAEAATEVNRYPDMAVTELTGRIAQALSVETEQISTGTGSVGVLQQIVTAACDAGDEVVFAWRSFEAYPIVVQLAGAVPVMVPVDAQGRHDLPAMAAAVTDRTRVLIVCTPNNPTGPVVSGEDLATLLDEVPPEVLLVIDEAYVEFVTDEQAPDALTMVRDHPNVVLLRTFSKAYGLAGLRVGYAVTHPQIAAALRKTALPFGVNSLAQAAAVASLAAEGELRERVGLLVAERERVCAALAGQGWNLPNAQGNFVWFPLGVDSARFAAACAEQALTVRPYGDDGVRVTIGEVEANDRLLALAEQWRDRPSS